MTISRTPGTGSTGIVYAPAGGLAEAAAVVQGSTITRRDLGLGLLSAAALGLAAPRVAWALEKKSVTISVGGKSSPNYLVLTAAERLGHFQEQGLTVAINDFNSGSRAIQALVGGSVDATVGYFDHAVHLQAKGQQIKSIVQLGRYPALVLAKRADLADQIKGYGDLRGRPIGVTGPGSSTHFLLNHLLEKNGFAKDSVSVIGVGVGASVVAAIDQKRVDAIVQVEPVVTMLSRDRKVEIMLDTRTPEGTQEVYGGPYPAAVLLAGQKAIQDNPATMQALVSAFVKTLHWIAKATPDEIVALMPADYQLGDKPLYTDVIRNNKATYSPTGLMESAAAETAVKFLGEMDPVVAKAAIDPRGVFDNRFVEAIR